MKKNYKILELTIILVVCLVSCAKPIPPYTVMMSDRLQIRIQQMVVGKDAEAILKSFPGNNLTISKDEEFLLMRLTFTNTSSTVVTIPYLYFLQVDTKSVTPKTIQIYFKDEFLLPDAGTWKKLDRLKMIPAGEKREGTICFVIPKNIIFKRFYVYQTYFTFPEGFQPADIN
jgi:hypothetical protein